MFKNLPQVQQASLESFIDSKDFDTIVEELNFYVHQLRKENEGLARTIEGAAQSAVELDCLQGDPELKEVITGNCIVAILITLEVIDRELEGVKLQKTFGSIRFRKT